MSEQEIEQEIQDKGLTAPRVTPEQVDVMIEYESYHRFNATNVVVCCLTLRNGFNVVGHSACASDENFDMEIGMKIAKENARSKIWELEGYLLRQKIYESRLTEPALNTATD